jgi:hypothetical protein
MIEHPVGSIEIGYHNRLVFGNAIKETPVKLVVLPHLKNVDHLPYIIAA